MSSMFGGNKILSTCCRESEGRVAGEKKKSMRRLDQCLILDLPSFLELLLSRYFFFLRESFPSESIGRIPLRCTPWNLLLIPQVLYRYLVTKATFNSAVAFVMAFNRGLNGRGLALTLLDTSRVLLVPWWNEPTVVSPTSSSSCPYKKLNIVSS